MSCHSVTQDELSGIGLAPDPVFENFRMLVMPPILLPEGENRADYIWIGTDLETTIFNYLQFSHSIPSNFDTVQVKNKKDLWDFYGLSKPTISQQVEILQKTIDTNQKHWNKITPENNDEFNKYYQLPPRLFLNFIQGKDTAVSYMDQDYIVAQLSLTKNFLLKFSIYDSMSKKTIDSWEVSLPKNIHRGNDPDLKIMENILKHKMSQTLKKITQEDIFELKIPKLTSDMSVFIDGKMALTPSIFITRGTHQFYISQLGDIVQGGKIDIQQNGELDIETALTNQKGQEIILKTNPTQTPIFINEKYLGLSPVTLTLPEGVHYIRASTLGYSHINYILKVDPYKPVKEIDLNLLLNDQAYEDRVKILRQVRLGTFFSGILSFGGLLYAYERTNFYQSKINQEVDIHLSKIRFNQFLTAQIVFGGLGGGLIITALVAQILEYQARDVGIGVDQDGNLGVRFRF